MSRKIIRRFISWRTRSRVLSLDAPTHSVASDPSSVFRSIDTLPLDRFITCICPPEDQEETPEPTERDLSALIISGTPTTEELVIAWTIIFLQYVDASRDSNTRYRITMARDIERLRGKFTRIEALLFCLQTIRVQEAVELLQGMGNEDLAFPGDDLPQYFADLNLARGRSREIRLDLELLEIELAEFVASEDMTPRERANKLSFLNILSRIATFKKVAVIRTSEITVAEFCAMFNEYLDHIKAVNHKKPIG